MAIFNKDKIPSDLGKPFCTLGKSPCQFRNNPGSSGPSCSSKLMKTGNKMYNPLTNRRLNYEKDVYPGNDDGDNCHNQCNELYHS